MCVAPRTDEERSRDRAINRAITGRSVDDPSVLPEELRQARPEGPPDVPAPPEGAPGLGDPLLEAARREARERARRKRGFRSTLLGEAPRSGDELGTRRTLIGS